jgi:hypothetical protein
MTVVITAPASVEKPGFRVFLAGAIDMGMAEAWQEKVIAMLQGVHDLVLINPRRAEFTPDTLDEQIDWELDGLEKADLILMWLPSESKAPISLFEAGLYWKSGKLRIGAGPGFYRRRNLEITARRYGVRLYDDLHILVQSLRRQIED